MALYKDEPIRHRNRTPCDAKGKETPVWADDWSRITCFEQQCSVCGAVSGQRPPTKAELARSRKPCR
jgi:hypothetical protein